MVLGMGGPVLPAYNSSTRVFQHESFTASCVYVLLAQCAALVPALPGRP